MTEDITCANCGAELTTLEDPNQCMLCGSPLCADCYDESSYCKACNEEE